VANDLLAERGQQPVGHLWVDNFNKRTPEIKLRRSQPYDRQRALNEDPRVISPWFSLIQSVKEKYGIQDEDTYNFDETGLMMGQIKAQMVFTGSEKRNAPKRIQPGNREWVTVIQGISAAGWAIPPFVIFAGKVLISSWYKDVPRDWVLEVSPNGWIPIHGTSIPAGSSHWTSNELAIAWLKHFNAHTKARSVGSYRLLIVDGHESHQSFEFHKFCKEEKIIVLCMPSHSSHILQPLDLVCFSLLKRAYRDEISVLARYSTKHIKKESFLPALIKAFNKAFSGDHVRASFRAAGLVPYNPEGVLSKLDVVLRTPTPPASQDAIWESKTPRNACEIEAQSTLIR
ncbi:DDE-domain-containing protein, partial [Sporormia fimetaria CBS 119925]